MKESFYSRCSPGPDDIGDSQTLQSLSVPDIPEDPPPLSQVRDRPGTYMQKTCDVAVKAILAKKNLRKKCVNRDKM